MLRNLHAERATDEKSGPSSFSVTPQACEQRIRGQPVARTKYSPITSKERRLAKVVTASAS